PDGMTWVASKFQLQLYGTFNTTVTFTDRGVNNHDIPTWAINAPVADDTRGFEINVFQSRFGLDLKGPRVWRFETEGKLELDFLGGGRDGNYVAVPRLRHAYAWLKSDYFDFMAGQTTPLFMPLSGVSAA